VVDVKKAEHIAGAAELFRSQGFAPGPAGGGYAATAGSSAVYSPEGIAIARAGPDVGGIARATLS